MNKKAIFLVMTMLVTLMLSVSAVQAKRGGMGKRCGCNNILAFRMEMVEIPTLGGEREWYCPPGETMPPPFGTGSATSYHVRGGSSNVVTVNLRVGQDGSVENLDLSTIDYVGSYDMDWNFETGDAIIRLREEITIYADKTKTEVRGTITLRTIEYLHNVAIIPGYYGEGIFVGVGGPIKKVISDINITIYDIAPTVLYLLGYPIPPGLSGHVITDIIDEDFTDKYPIRYEEAPPPNR